MLEALKSYWQFGSRFISIEQTGVDNNTIYNIVTAKSKNGEFTQIESASCNILEEIRSFTGKAGHCFLTINTDKVLIKEIVFEQEPEVALQKAFPSIKQTDFYYQVINEGDKCFVAICRKEYVKLQLELFAKAKWSVVGFTLGFSAVSLLTDELNDLSIPGSRQNIEIADNKVNVFGPGSNNSVKLQIADVHIDSKFVVALSGLSGYQVPYIGFGNVGDSNHGLKKSHGEKRFFSNGIKVGAAILFLLLLINAAAFSYYYKKQQNLTEQAQLASSQKNLYTSKLEEVQKKEAMVANILDNTGSKSSLYINRIVNTLPESISLSNIKYQPIEGAIRVNREIEYFEKRMVLAGITNNNSEFSNWMNRLESLEFVDRVEVTGFGDNSGATSFELNVLLK